MSIETLYIPDMGSADEVEVIEVNVSVGEEVEAEQTLLVLESDKTTMDIPAPKAGKIAALLLNVGDKVVSGAAMVDFLNQVSTTEPIKEKAQYVPQADLNNSALSDSKVVNNPASSTAKEGSSSTPLPLFVPDLGTTDAVSVIEVHVNVGDKIEKEQTLMVLESDKTTMDIPAQQGGILKAWLIREGDEVSGGTLMGSLTAENTFEEVINESKPAFIEAKVEEEQSSFRDPANPKPVTPPVAATKQREKGAIYAGPAVRRLAREMGIALQQVQGSAPRGRISKDDIKEYVKTKINEVPQATQPLSSLPVIDFSQFGETQMQPLNKVKQVTARNMTASWQHIPMVTHFEESDVTELEHYRRDILPSVTDKKVTLLAFAIKALARALEEFPQFNASLDEQSENLIIKKYINIGIAVETPQGLMVPVIKDVNHKSVVEIAAQAAKLAEQARQRKLPLESMQGSCMTISSLGGIGGTQFTPIVNAPEVAILGLSRGSKKPVFDESSQAFVARLMLPLSLTYDHRVIDGAEAARFSLYLAKLLSDIRHLLI